MSRPFIETLRDAIKTKDDAAEYMKAACQEDGWDGLRDAMKNVSDIFGISQDEIPNWLREGYAPSREDR